MEWMFPVTAGSYVHDTWYLGSALTRFPGRDGSALRAALAAGHTRAEVNWTWTAGKLPRHCRIQLRSMFRFLRLCRQLMPVGTLR